jgi:hypothetical protein
MPPKVNHDRLIRTSQNKRPTPRVNPIQSDEKSLANSFEQGDHSKDSTGSDTKKQFISMIYQNLIRKTQASDLPAPVLANKQTSLYERRKVETAHEDSRRVYVLQKLQLNGNKGHLPQPEEAQARTPRVADVAGSIGSMSNYNNSNSMIPHHTEQTGGTPQFSNESHSVSSEASKQQHAEDVLQTMLEIEKQNTM